MVAALVLLALQTPPEPDLKNGTVVTLSTLVSRLRDPGGPEVFVAPELKNEALFLKGDFGTSARLRAHIARAACAEWAPDGVSLRLERSPALRKKLREAEIATLAADLRAALPKEPPPTPLTPEEVETLRGLKLDESPDEAVRGKRDEEIRRRIEAASLESRPIARFFAALDPVRLAEALAGKPGPVRMLGRGEGTFLPLPLDGPAFLAADRADRLLLERPPSHPVMARRADVRANATLGVVVARISGTLCFSLDAVAPNGEAVQLGARQIYPAVPRPEEPLWPGETPDEDREIPRVERTPPEIVRRDLLDGVHDPLHTLVMPSLSALIAGETRPIVLNLPDDSIGAFWPQGSFQEASRRLRAFVTPELHDGAIIGRPRLPLETTALRLRRSGVPGWIAAARLDVPLDEAASSIAGLGPAADVPDLPTSLHFVAGLEPITQDAYPYSPPLALWEALPRPARAALDRGETLGSRVLSPAARAAAGRLFVTSDLSGTGTAFLDRRGALPPFELRWTADTHPIAAFVGRSGSPLIWRAESIGMLLAQQRAGEHLGSDSSYPDIARARFRAGFSTARRYGIAYAPDPARRIEGKLLTETVLNDGPAVPWTDLPPALLNPIRKALEDAGGGDRSN